MQASHDRYGVGMSSKSKQQWTIWKRRFERSVLRIYSINTVKAERWECAFNCSFLLCLIRVKYSTRCLKTPVNAVFTIVYRSSI